MELNKKKCLFKELDASKVDSNIQIINQTTKNSLKIKNSFGISIETYLFLLITQQGSPEAVNLYNDILSSFYKNGTQQIKSANLRSSLFTGLILSFKS